MGKFNPLLDRREPEKPISTITASESLTASSVPLSPIDGRPMLHLKCRENDVWVDTKNRLVIPFKRS